jgi:hypothetical protein
VSPPHPALLQRWGFWYLVASSAGQTQNVVWSLDAISTAIQVCSSAFGSLRIASASTHIGYPSLP